MTFYCLQNVLTLPHYSSHEFYPLTSYHFFSSTIKHTHTRREYIVKSKTSSSFMAHLSAENFACQVKPREWTSLEMILAAHAHTRGSMEI